MTLERKLRSYANGAATFAATFGVATLLGWTLGIPWLRDPFLTGAVMRVNSGLCITVYGVALLILSRNPPAPTQVIHLARLVAGLVFLFTAAAWFELVTGLELGVDRLLFPVEANRIAPDIPVLFPLKSVAPLALLGAGLLAIRPPGWTRFSLSTWCGLAVMETGLLLLTDHLLAAANLALPPNVALTSTLCFIALGSGLACVRANQDFLRIIAPTHPVNGIARRTLLAALLLPVGLHVAQVWIMLGAAAPLQEQMTMLTALFGVSLLGLCTYGLQRLHLIDEQRADAEKIRDILLARLQQQAATLQYQVAARTQELSILNERMQFAVRSAGFGLWDLDFTSKKIIWDDRSLEIYGVNRAAFSGDFAAWAKLVHPDDLPDVEQRMAAAVKGNSNHFEADFRIRRPDGALRHLHAMGYIQRDAAGQAVRVIGLDQDVTLERSHQAELAEVNERLQLALRAEGAGVWDHDVASDTTKWDARQCEIYGVNPGEFDSRSDTWRKLVHPDDKSRILGVSDSPDSHYLENHFRIVRPNGEVRHIRSVGYLYRNAAGTVTRIVGLDSDVTATVEVRDKLRVAEERLTLALQASGEGMWDWDVRTGQIYYSPRWLAMLGYTRRDLPGTVAAREQLIHPEDYEGVLMALQDHFQGRTPIYRSEHRLRTKDGNWIWTLSRGEVVRRDERGQPLRVVGMQGDITERKVLEQQLRRNQEIALQVGRLAQIGAWELDPATQKVTWDPEVYRIHEVELGYKPTFASAISFYPPESRGTLLQAIAQAEKDGTPFDLELLFLTARNRRARVRIIGRSEIREGHVVRIYGAFQDITTRYDAEQARHRLETQLFQAQKMETLGTLAGGIAHDFNNLLTGIMGYQDLALDSLKPSDDAHHCIVAAREASLRARGLVDQILTFSRPAADSEPMSVDLSQVVEEARRFLRATIPATIEIQTEVHPPIERVEADATQMHQVLLNLGSNAAHAMRLTGGIFRVSLRSVELDAATAARLGGLMPGRHVQMTVSDTGHGIDPETMKRIFDPFFTTKNVGEGTGLGLSVVHGIVRAHQGAIQASSTPGHGARFDIYLPAAQTEADRGDEHAQPQARGQGEKIFIVDDEALVGTFSKTALIRSGYDAVSFDSPMECLKAMQHNPTGCSVLVTDQTMPSMTGMELAAEVRSFAPQLPIIIMSGYFSKISPAALEQIGHISLLAKPFTVEEITGAVHRALHPEEA
jgi:PAS domain S-box-containing protein